MMLKKDEFWINKNIVTKRDRSSFEMILDYPFDLEEGIDSQDFIVKLYFFPPASLSSTAGWHQRQRFYENLKNNIRWHTPEETHEVFKFPNTLKYLEKKELIEEKAALIEDVIGENKLFANRLIKKLKSDHDDLDADLTNFTENLIKYRTKIISQIISDQTVHDSVLKHCRWCDEYLSYYFKNFLLKNGLESEEKWRQFLEEENSYIIRYKDYKVVTNEEDRRRFMQRASMLKKFINEILYLDLKEIKKSSFKKNMAAAIAAGLAASVNFFAQYSSHYGGVERDNNLKFFILLLLAVSIYVLKDRVKDITKEYFNNRMLSEEADYKYDVFSKKMPGLPVLKIGRIMENLRFLKRADVPDEIYYVWKKARQRATGSLVGHGEVVNFEKSLKLERQKFGYGKNWSIKDVMRFDLRDFYSTLEESHGNLNFFDEDEGKIELEGEKSYSLDLVVNLISENGKKREITYQTYRLFLEKEGLIEIEDTSNGVCYSYKESLS